MKKEAIEDRFNDLLNRYTLDELLEFLDIDPVDVLVDLYYHGKIRVPEYLEEV